MSDTQTPLLKKSVREFFCPEIAQGSLSFNDPLHKSIVDLCAAFSVESVGDLTAKTIDELRSASFPAREVSRIVVTLAESGLGLKSTFPAAGGRGVCPPISIPASVQWVPPGRGIV